MKQNKLNRYLFSLTITLSLCMCAVQAKTVNNCYFIKYENGEPLMEKGKLTYVDYNGNPKEKGEPDFIWEQQNKNSVVVLKPGRHEVFPVTDKEGIVTKIEFDHPYCVKVTVSHDLKDTLKLTHEFSGFWKFTRTLDSYWSSIIRRVKGDRRTEERLMSCEATTVEEAEVKQPASCMVPQALTQEQIDGQKNLQLFY